MTKCCDSHDFCYDTCGTKRRECDGSLQQCLTNYCQQQSTGQGSEWLDECMGMGNMISGAASGFGCQAFLDSQANACICNPEA